MVAKAEQLRAELIQRLVAQVGCREGLGLDDVERRRLETFIRRFYGNVPPEDILGETVENLFGAALSLWEFAQERRPGAPKIRAYNPRRDDTGWSHPHSIVEVVNDDMPFLVDSVTAELNRLGAPVHLVIHPILQVRRSPEGKLLALDGEAETSAGVPPVKESHMQVRTGTCLLASELEDIPAALEKVLADVRVAARDWKKMRAKALLVAAELEGDQPPVPPEDIEDVEAFLSWLAADHFTFLGYREYSITGASHPPEITVVANSGLGVLRDPQVSVFDGLRNFEKLPPEAQQFLLQRRLMIVTKTNLRATVHRPVFMDAIAIKQFDDSGHAAGERLFIGLFTSNVYSGRASEIPLLRRKIANCLERSGFEPASHDGKALMHILETFPREEMFQISEDDLFDIAMGVLHLQNRQRIALFVIRDPFGRFVSCLVYLPRDRYSTELRLKIQAILAEAFDGRISAFHTQFTETALARLHVVIATTPGTTPAVDIEMLERRIVEASRSWADALQTALVAARGEEAALPALRHFENAFPSAYRERFDPATAVFDIRQIEATIETGSPTMYLYHDPEAAGPELRLKIYNAGPQIALSDILPTLEHMGLRVVTEMPYRIAMEAAGRPVWIHDLWMAPADPNHTVEVAAVRDKFHETLARVWRGEMEDDGFNRLVLVAGFYWREVSLLRAYCKYLRQTAATWSQAYMEETLAKNNRIARLLVDLFLLRFDPTDRHDSELRSAELLVEIDHALDAVVSLDEDRILRRYLNLILSTLRTNFFQTGADGQPKPYISFKLDSQRVEELPAPRPFVEIWVFNPRVEAVHLRGGKVARGGIRWSDRREDFRSEVLGLMKAQTVKNAVIVPVGSKGGFVVKRPPAAGGRDALMQEVIDCYKTMMRGMLDVTDNRVGEEVVAPPAVVRYDDDDPYLVVAADKGTATFSDIANGISAEDGFWLGDAFASGGSAGYDHKKMGITARGAWEAVKRHFRELGMDVQSEDFSAVGVGDMSGDVFGNGMLQSRHIRLLAAFDHRHIFLDPDPDPERSFAERQRLFALPRSAWSDYDAALISPGGGVFDRSAKSVKLSPEVRRIFRITAEVLTPSELIRELLKGPVDLLFFGGIGTYVKASTESQTAVGDRANDAVRVDGRDLRCRVVGEGANLGFTQRGRVEAALAGHKLNTDAVDNSAGVDTSDHEVNLKILLNGLVAQGRMSRAERDALLAEMTEEVAALVLRDNYLQTQAISVAEAGGWMMLDQQGRFMRALEKQGKLDRALEFLPDDETLERRQAARQGLTRPELSVLLAYAKMTLYDELLPSDLPDDAQLAEDLELYFPERLRQHYASEIRAHQLRREIVATVVTNSLVNRVGPTFLHVMKEKTAMAAWEIARAYAAMRGILDLRRLWAEIEALDGRVPATLQITLLREINRIAEQATLWLLRNAAQPLDIANTLAIYRPGIQTLSAQLFDYLADPDRAEVEQRASSYVEAGAPPALAREVATLEALLSGLDIVRIAEQTNTPVLRVARIYFAVGDRFGLDWLRDTASGLPMDTHWDRMAVAAIVDDLYGHQRELTTQVLRAANGALPASNGPDPVQDAVRALIEEWIAGRGLAMQRTATLIEDLRQTGSIDLAKLAVANRQLRSLIGN